jgi:proteasome beta subunit
VNVLEKQEKATFKSGTTIIAANFKDFVLLASDKQGSMGNIAHDLEAQKINPLNDRMALGLAGTLGDAQQVIRILKAQVNLYEFERSKKISIKATTSFLSNLLNAHRYYPYFAGFILVGFDDAPKIRNADVIGGISEVSDFTTIGSGSTLAMGVLEANYNKNMSRKEAVELAYKAVGAAKKRDIYSGSDTDILIISKDGIEKINK